MPRISSWESVDTFKIVPEEQICERMCEEIGVVEVPKIASQKSVEPVTIFLQVQISDRKCEQIGVIVVSRLNGCVNRFGLLSKKVSRQSKFSFRTAIPRGCVKSLELLKCPRF